MTKQESHLWYDFLRSYPVKIYRQRIIDNYIVDFYCASRKLVIELDGAQHYTIAGDEYDCIRTEILEQFGIEVIRFSNLEINNNFESVCTVIEKKIKGETTK